MGSPTSLPCFYSIPGNKFSHRFRALQFVPPALRDTKNTLFLLAPIETRFKNIEAGSKNIACKNLHHLISVRTHFFPINEEEGQGVRQGISLHTVEDVLKSESGRRVTRLCPDTKREEGPDTSPLSP